jgi:hypothetical protein
MLQKKRPAGGISIEIRHGGVTRARETRHVGPTNDFSVRS